jgi:hypothetical protein
MRPLRSNSLQLTRLASGKLERVLPAELCENGSGVARAAGQLNSRPIGRPGRCNQCLDPPDSKF